MKWYKTILDKNVLPCICTVILLLPAFQIYSQDDIDTLQQPGYYRMKLGDFRITAISDGTIPQDVERLLTNVKPGVVNKLMRESYQTTLMESSVNSYVVECRDSLILIDAGAGELLGSALGKLDKNLRAAGYQASRVMAVLITHLHPDHIGGLAIAGEMAFPNAIIYVSEKELAYWLSRDEQEKAGDAFKAFF